MKLELTKPIIHRRGILAEKQALNLLRRAGLKLVTRNYRCRVGEIDLVMRDRKTLVFVEVRFRSKSCFGSGADSVNYRKQQKLIRAAHHFLQTSIRGEWPVCRFDVIEAQPGTDKTSLEFNWIKNAFDLQ